MGFVSKSLYNLYEYQINMDEVLAPVFNLIIEMSANKGPQSEFHEWGTKVFDVNKIYGQDKIPESEDGSLFLGKLVNYITEELYETASNLKNSNIVFIHNKKKLLICHQSVRKPSNVLANWLKKFSPIKSLFSFVSDKQIKAIEEKVTSLITETYYFKAVKVESPKKWEAWIVQKNWLVPDDIKRELLDNASIWIDTTTEFNAFKNFETNEVYELSRSDNFIGLEIGSYILPVVSIENIIDESHFPDYFLEALKHIYSSDRPGKTDNPCENEFLEASKNSDFNKLLSFVSFNLYIPKDVTEIKGEYQKFFEEVVGIEEIENFESYQLYVSNPSIESKEGSKTMIGIYEKVKKGSEYNVLNWITASENELTSHVIGRSKNQKSNQVYVFRPQYCHYFISKFFEDCFSRLLQELRCLYVTNAELSYDNDNDNDKAEIDAIIKAEDGSFIYVENKTTLNRYNVEKTIANIEKFHSFICKNYQKIRFKYVIIAPYSNENLEESYKYFINKSPKKSESRDGIKCNIYDFEIPIAKFEEVNLHCIVEPEYDKMKTIVENIIK